MLQLHLLQDLEWHLHTIRFRLVLSWLHLEHPDPGRPGARATRNAPARGWVIDNGPYLFQVRSLCLVGFDVRKPADLTIARQPFIGSI